MSARRRRFVLMAVLAAGACATPAVAQTTAPPLSSSGGALPSAASVPDLSGIWTHLTWPDVEPPLAGPGPVTNRSRVNGVSSTTRLVGDYTNPILTPTAAQVVKEHGEISLAGIGYPTPSNQCWPAGVPFVFSSNIGMQMLQQPHQVTILYSNDHEVRHVRLNDQHPAQVTPSWYGDSVGHYEGDTLVIDTVGIRTDRPFAMLDMYGTPYTKALHVIERYRLLDNQAAKDTEERGQRGLTRAGGDPGFARNPDYKGKGLQLEFTVEDDGAFVKPWSASVSYRRPVGSWPEMACAENPYKYNTEADPSLPTAAKPDF